MKQGSVAQWLNVPDFDVACLPHRAVSLQKEKTARTINSSPLFLCVVSRYYNQLGFLRKYISSHPPPALNCAEWFFRHIRGRRIFLLFFSFSRGLLISMKIPDRSTMEYSLPGLCITGPFTRVGTSMECHVCDGYSPHILTPIKYGGTRIPASGYMHLYPDTYIHNLNSMPGAP